MTGKIACVLIGLVVTAPGFAQEKPAVSVFPFENQSGPANDWLATALSSVITVSLQAGGAVDAVSQDQVHRAFIDADIYPQSLFDGKITPTFLKYHLDWKAGTCVLGRVGMSGDSLTVSFRLCLVSRKAFTPAETIRGKAGSFTDLYLIVNQLIESLYGQLILQAGMTIPREAIVASHVRAREAFADWDGYRAYITSWTALAYYDDGLAASEAHKADDAIRYFTKAQSMNESGSLKVARNLSTAYLVRGTVAFEDKKWDDASADYRSAIQADTTNAAAWYDLGNVFKEQGRYDEALSQYARALSLDAVCLDAQLNTGYVLNAQGRYGEAAAAYEKALKIGGDTLAVAHFYAGVVYDNANDTANAKRCYLRALALDPKLAPAHLNLGTLLKKQKDLAGAQREYTSALTYDPNNALAHRNLGNLLMNDQNETAQAVMHLERTLALEPGQPDADIIRANLEVLKKRIKP